MQEYTDKELLALFGQEDQRPLAFERIVEKYSQRIYWTIRKIVVSHYDTDDILQNTLLKLWQALPTFRGDSSLYTWLYRMAVNQALTHLRERKRHGARFASDTDENYFERVIAEEGLFDPDQAEIALQRAINTLPSQQRATFIMRYYDEIPFKEIAQIMNLSEGSVKASYHIAREKVETQIKLSLT